jgi:anti-sigma factor RsiW
MSDFSEEDVTAYLDGELGPEQTRALEAALVVDPELRRLEARLRQSVAVVKALPALEVAPVAKLRHSVLAAIAPEPWWRSWLTLPRLFPAGLVASAGLAVILWWPSMPIEELDQGDEERLLLAHNLEVVEDFDLVDFDSVDDVDVVAALHELKVSP